MNRTFRAVCCGLAGLAMSGSVATSAAAAGPAVVVAQRQGALTGLVGLSAERILLADKVAAAKFGTDSPIEDPAREQVVLDQAAALALDAGLDTDETVAFFRAQIEMSKQVQRGLFDRWTAHPEQAPTERPDLATEVRPELDRITVEFIDQLVATDDLRGPGARCHFERVYAVRVADHRYGLDRLHEQALHGAVEPICTRQEAKARQETATATQQETEKKLEASLEG